MSITINNVTTDNIINLAESNVTTTTITGTVGSPVADGNTITLTINGAPYPVTASGSTFAIPVSTVALLMDFNTTIDASVTPSGGGAAVATGTKSYTIDTTPPTATITINDVTADNVVNLAESGGMVAITGTVAGDVADSDTITLTVNGVNYTGTSTSGAFSINVSGSDLAADTSVGASVTTQDAAQNPTTATDSQTYTVDTTPPTATITINDVTADNVVNLAESGGMVAITGTVAGDVADSDTITLTVNGVNYTGTSTSGAFSINVSGSDLAADTSVGASVTTQDAAQNPTTATDSQTYTVDTTPPTATITINDVTADNVVNLAESGGMVAITGTVAGDVADSDTITLTVNGVNYTGTSTSGAFSINVSGSDLAADTSVGASVTTQDAAQNPTTATDSQTYTVDTTPPTATITINDVTADNVVNLAESGGMVAITGTVAGDVADSDTITLTVNGVNYTGTSTSGAFSINVSGSDLAADTSVGASVTTQDAAQNPTTATDSQTYTVDTTPPTATITINDVTADNVVNLAESGGMVAITGTVAGDVADSDTITLTVNGVNYTGTSTSGAFSINVSGSDLAADTSVGASVTTQDAAQNPTTATDSQTYTVDTTPPTATITINDVTADNVVNLAESGGMVAITGTVAGDVADSDTITLTVNGVNYTGTSTSGAFSINVSGSDLAADTSVGASVTTQDAAQNPTTATDSQTYTVDTTPPTATITINDVTADNVVNLAESGGMVAITGTVAGDVADSDTITLTVNGVNYTGTSTSGAFSINVSGSDLAADTSVGASVTTQDAAQNPTTATDSQTYTVDTTPPTATITINDVTADNVVNLAESGGMVAITGTVAGDVADSDTITLTVNGVNYTGTSTSGAFSINVSGSDLAADTSVGASVTTQDAAQNPTTATDSQTYTVDTTPPTATITINDVTADNVVNLAESGGMVAITGTVAGDVADSDTITLTVNGVNYTGTSTSGAFSINVSGSDLAADTSVGASVTTQDAAQNPTTATDSQTYTVDTTPPTATITINDVTADNVVNLAESGGMVAITGTVAGDVADSDTITLTVNGVNYTGTSTSGAFSINVSGSDLAADTSVGASVTTQDAAQNPTTATDSQTYTVDTTADVSDGAGADAPLTVSFDDMIIGSSEANSITVNVAGLDVDATGILTISSAGGGAPVTVTNVTGSTNNIDISSLPDGALTAVLDVTDNAGNTASVSGNSAILDQTFPVDDLDQDGTILDGTTIDEYVEPNDLAIAGQVLGTFPGSDSGVASDLTYSFASGSSQLTSSDGAFELVVDAATGVTELQVADPTLFDFEDDATPSVTIYITDGAGNQTTDTFTVTLNDLNDAPEVDQAQTTLAGGPTERVDLSTDENAAAGFGDSGTFQFTDDDISDTHSIGVLSQVKDDLDATIADPLGFLSAGSSSPGKIEWTFGGLTAPDMLVVDALGVDETIIQKYTVTINDGDITTEQVVEITITGTNDAPTIAGGPVSTSIDESDAANLTDTGTLMIADVDTTDVVSSSVTGVTATGTLGTFTANDAALAAMMSVTGDLDNTEVTDTLTWTFDSGTNTTFDYLAEGEKIVLEYTIKIEDDSGETNNNATETVTVTINGTNDRPEISVGGTDSATGTLAESTGLDANDNLTDSGTLTLSDDDSSDEHTIVVSSPATVAISDGAAAVPVPPALQAALNSAFTANNDTANNTIEWAFELADTAVDFLNVGDTVTVSYDVTADDDGGFDGTGDDENSVSEAQTVTFTISGTNDAPTLQSTTGAAVQTDTSVDVDLSALGADLDREDDGSTLAYAITTNADTGGSASITGTTLTFVPGIDFDDLAAGETRNTTIKIQATDEQTATSTIEDVVFTVTGTNDAPTIGVVAGTDTDSGGVTETNAGNLIASGDLTIADADTSNLVTVVQPITVATSETTTGAPAPAALLAMMTTSGDLDASETSDTLTWAFNSATDTFDYLSEGETLVLDYTITVTDGTATASDVVKITVTGSNDVPSITSTAFSETVEEAAEPDAAAADLTASGSIAFTDLDLTDVGHEATATVATSGDVIGIPSSTALDGYLTLTPTKADGASTGTIAWSFTSPDASFDYLGEDDSVILTYTVTLDDKDGGTTTQDITVTINGTNDAPVITAAGTGSVTEIGETSGDPALNAGTISDTGTLAFTDVDATDTFTASVVSGVTVVSGTQPGTGFATGVLQGLFSLDNTSVNTTGGIGWTFSSDESHFDYLANGESIVLEYTVKVDDGESGTDTETVTITVNGSNDEPVITSSNPTPDTEGNSLVTTPLPPVAALADEVTLDLFSVTTIIEVDESDTQSISTVGTVSGMVLGVSNMTSAGVLSSIGGATAAQIEALFDVSSDDGNVVYDKNQLLFDRLEDGQSITVDITYAVTSGSDTEVHTVSMEVQGANDAPYFTESGATFTSSVSEFTDGSTTTGEVENTDTHTQSITVKYDDIELNDTHIASVTQLFESGVTPAIADYLGTFSTAFPSGATGASVGEVLLSFNLDDLDIDSLTEGETITQKYLVSVTDADDAGSMVTKPIEITITGTNDAPEMTVISPTGGVAFTEDADIDATGAATTQTLSGTVTFNDVDISTPAAATEAADTHTVTAAVTKVDGVAVTFYSGAEGTFTFDTNAANASSALENTVTWDYEIDDTDFDYLADGTTLVLTYTVTVEDENEATDTADVTFTITGTNDSPMVSQAITDSGDEGVATALTVDLLQNATDADAGQTATLAVVAATVMYAVDTGAASADEPAGVTLSGNGISVDLTNAAFNTLREGVTQQIVVTYDVIDTYSATVAQTATITVTGTNDAPVAAADVVVTHDENQADTVVLATASATDVDVGDTVSYTITDGNTAGLFEINANGEISLVAGKVLDAEVSQEHILEVTASDDAPINPITDTQQITINVNDLDEHATTAPVDTVAAANAVDENAAVGDSIGLTVNSTDDDVTSGTITYSVEGGTGASLFDVDSSTGEVTVKTGATIDRENLPTGAVGDTVTLEIKATPTNGAASATETFTITINDVDEFDVSKPTDADTATNTIAENASVGDTVGITASASDDDATINTVTYSLTDDAGGLFAINSTSGVVTVNGTLDYETAETHTITVKADSSDDSSSTEDFTIAVTDVNDKAPVFTSSNAVDANENQTAVVTLAATDADTTGETTTFSIVSGADQGLFSISSSGVVTFTGAPDFEAPADAGTDNDYVVTVRASDGVNTTDQIITVTVKDVNEAPTAVDLAVEQVTIAENTTIPAAGIKVADINITDDSPGTNAISWTGADAASFNIVGTELFFIGASPNFETPADDDSDGVYDVTVSVSDLALTGSSPVTDSFSLTVTDVNENPDITIGTDDSAAETLTETDLGLVSSGTLSVEDVDASDTVTVAVTGLSQSGTTLDTATLQGYMSVDTGNVIEAADTTGDITWSFNSSSEAFDYLGSGETLTLTYTLEVTDSGGLKDTQDVTITINGTDDGPVLSVANTAIHIESVDDNLLDSTSRAPSLIDNTATLSDADAGTDYDEGTLVVSVNSGLSTDHLNLDDSGTVSIDGSNNVSVSGTQIGTISGQGGNTFTVTFGANATLAAAEALIQAITYATSEDNPTGAGLTRIINIAVTDGVLATDSESVTLTITPSNDSPTPVIDAFSVNENTFNIFNIKSNDTDPENDSLTIVNVADADDAATTDDGNTLSLGTFVPASAVVAPANPGIITTDLGASVTVQDNGQINYDLQSSSAVFNELAEGDTITDSITYTVSDGDLTTEQTVNFEITGVNDQIDAANDTITATEASPDTDLNGNLFDNDTDVDIGDTMQITSVSTGTNIDTVENTATGFRVVTTNGAVVEINRDTGDFSLDLEGLADGAAPSATFTYVVADSGGLSDSATVTLNLTGENDAPTVEAALSDQSTAEDAAFSFAIPTGTFDDVDVGDSLTLTASGLPSWASFDGTTITGTPDNDDVAVTTVTITATDGDGAAVTSAFDLTVTNVNDAPTVAVALSDQSIAEDATFNFAIPAGTFADVDAGDSLTLTASGLPSWASFDGSTITGTPDNDDVAVTTVTITATDGDGAAVTSAFDLTVTNVNDAPTVAVALSDQSIAEDAAFSFAIPAGTFADVDAGDSLTLTASGLPSWASFDGTTITGTPDNDDVAVTTVTITATDGDGAAVTSAFDLTVTNVNDAPTVAVALSDQSIAEDAAFSFAIPAGTFADVDAGDSLTLTASGLPSWASFDGSTITGTPDNDDVAVTTVTITATDGDGAAVTSAFDLTVTNVNDAPTVAVALSDQSIAEDAAFNFAIPAGTFADVDAGDSLTLTASGLPSWASFDGTTITGTPDNDDVAVTTVTITATDGDGAAVTSAFDLTVTNVNDAPTVAVALNDQSIAEDAAFNFAIPAGTFADVDAGDSLTLTASGLPSWASFDGTTITGTPDNDDVAVTTVTITATDGDGAAVTSAFDLTVTNVNDAPTVAVALSDQSIAEDAAFNFAIPAGTFADVDAGDSLTLTASGLPSWASFDGTTITGTPDNDDVAVTTVTITATDGDGATVTSAFDLTVTNVNDAPTVAVALSDQSIAEDATFNFAIPAGTFADVDAGDSLTLTASGLPSWASFDGTTITGTPDNDDVAVTTVTITATDGDGAAVTSAFDLTVTNVNDAPTVAVALSDQSIAEDAAFSFAIPAGTFADVDAGDSLTLTASGLPSWASFDGSTITGTPDNDDVAVTTVTITATDGDGAAVTSAFDLTVTNVNDAPTVAVALSDQSIAEDAAFNFAIPAGTFADVDAGDSLTLTASGLPSWASFDGSTITGTPDNDDVAVTTVTITATDGDGAAVTSAFDLTVTNVNDAPTVAVALSDQSIAEDAAFNFAIPAGTFADVDAGDSLTLTASGLPSWASFDGTTITGTPDNDDVAVTTVTITATDGDGAAVTSAFDLTVTNVNDAPTVAVALNDQSIAEDAAFNFAIPAGTFADVDAGDSLTLTASGLPSWASFDGSTITGTPDNDDVAVTTVTITATDGDGAAVTSAFDLTVTNVNDAPTVAVALSDQSIAEDAAFNFAIPAGTFADVDAGDSLTLTASGLPSWASFDGTTITGTPDNDDVAVTTVTITATDGDGAAVTSAFDLTVTNVNDAPTVAVALSDQSIAEDAAFSFAIPAATFDDVDVGDSLTLTASGLPSWASFDGTTITGTPDNDDVAVTTVTITATDGDGAAVTSAFDLTVTNVNDAPTVAVALSDQSIAEDATFSFAIPAGTFDDVDVGDSLTLTASGLPSWASFDGTTITGTPDNDDVAVTTVTITATDGDGATVTSAFDLTVTNVNDAPEGSPTATLDNGAEDTVYVVTAADLLAGFSDVDLGDTLNVANLTSSDGSIVDNMDGTYSVTPSSNFSGSVTLTYDVEDDNGGSLTGQTLSYTVDAVTELVTRYTDAGLSTLVQEYTNDDQVSSNFTQALDDATLGQAILVNEPATLGDLTGLGNITVTADDTTIIANGPFDANLVLDATVSSVSLGGDADLNVTGNESINTIVGNAGDNILNGRLGADVMKGGLGTDWYYVDNAGDTITELSNEGTDDRVATNTDYTLGSGVHVEMFTTTSVNGTSDLNLIGNRLSQTIVGNAGDNIIGDGGGSGADVLRGLGGDDQYIIRNSNTQVAETAIQGDNDRVSTAVDYTLGADVHVESFTTTSSGGTLDLKLIGNRLSQTIVGNAGNNIIGDGGGSGADVLRGLGGDDQYIIRNSNTQVIETATQGDNDRVSTAVDYTLGAGVHVESFTTTSSGGTSDISLIGNRLSQTIVGNAGDNIIGDGGGSGADVLRGLGGDDQYIVRNSNTQVAETATQGDNDRVSTAVDYTLGADVHVELFTTTSSGGTLDLNLIGNKLSQTIVGNAGDNIIGDGGGSGADVLRGLSGDDQYIIRNSNTQIVEAATQGDNDRVSTAVDYTLGAGVHVESFTTTSSGGTSDISLIGNEISQAIFGNKGDNRLDGGDGLDVLHGGAGADSFVFSTALGENNVDTILDFNVTDDQFELDGSIFAGLSMGTLAVSAFEANASGTAMDSDDLIIFDTSSGALYYDADGNGANVQVQFAEVAVDLLLSHLDFDVV